LFTVAELPTTRAQHEHHLAAIKMTSMMVGGRSKRKVENCRVMLPVIRR